MLKKFFTIFMLTGVFMAFTASSQAKEYNGSAKAAPSKAEVAQLPLEAVLKTDITGTYKILGTTPGQDGQYTGTVTITKTGTTYQVNWTLGEEVNFGTGLLLNDSLAVAYTNSKGVSIGLVLYKISADGKTMDGIWTMVGANVFGTEQLIKVK